MAIDRTDGAWSNVKWFIKRVVFKAEKLVNLAKYDYRLEPNVTFTPDQNG